MDSTWLVEQQNKGDALPLIIVNTLENAFVGCKVLLHPRNSDRDGDYQRLGYLDVVCDIFEGLDIEARLKLVVNVLENSQELDVQMIRDRVGFIRPLTFSEMDLRVRTLFSGIPEGPKTFDEYREQVNYRYQGDANFFKRNLTRMSLILELLRVGNKRNSACKAAGISTSTFYKWMESDDEFSHAVEQASAQAEVDRVSQILKSATDKDIYFPPLAWLSERSNKEWKLNQDDDKLTDDEIIRRIRVLAIPSNQEETKVTGRTPQILLSEPGANQS